MSDHHQHRARIFLHRGDLVHAREAWEAAVADDRAAGNQRELSNSLGNLGNTCALMEDFAAAEQCYQEVLDIQRTEHNEHAIAHTLVNLGNLHIGADRAEKARPYYLEALDLLHTLNDDRALGILYNNLALQEARDGRWEDAVRSFTRALDHHRVVGNEEGLAVTYSQLGKCYLDGGDLVRAERCLNNASEHYIKLGQEPAEAAVLRLLATVSDGVDPHQDHQAKTIRIDQLCDIYLEEGCSRKKDSTIETDRSLIRRHIKPLLGRRLVSSLTKADVELFMTRIATGHTKADIRTRPRGRAIVKGGKGTANRTPPRRR